MPRLNILENYICIPPYVFMAWFWVKPTDDFTFFFGITS
jgi:hypothetical protein